MCRVTSYEGDIGGGHLSRFQELETVSPVILTTSQLLTTGVDVPTCKNIVIARVIGSMTDFKQIIGRGTRVREDYGKLYFNIVDYTGSATRLFADPEFDGEPALIDEEVIDENGEVVEQTVIEDESQGEEGAFELVLLEFSEDEPSQPRKLYFDGSSVEVQLSRSCARRRVWGCRSSYGPYMDGLGERGYGVETAVAEPSVGGLRGILGRHGSTFE